MEHDYVIVSKGKVLLRWNSFNLKSLCIAPTLKDCVICNKNFIGIHEVCQKFSCRIESERYKKTDSYFYYALFNI